MQFVRSKTLFMGEKINRMLAKPVYPYLYGFAFLVFKSSAYFGSFKILPALNALIIYFFVTYISLLFFRKFTGTAGAAVPVLIVWTSLFHVVGVAQLFHYPYSYIPLSFYVWFYGFALLVLLATCRVSVKISLVLSETVNRLINVFLMITSCIFFFTGIKKMQETKIETRAHSHVLPTYPDLIHQKDIVWILMDEYGASAPLKEQFGFTNPLDSILEKERFSILKTMHSRYNNTLFSVNSIFNLDDSIMPSSFYEGVDLLRHSELVPLIESSGYQFVNLGFFDMAEHPMMADRSGYPYTYQQQLFSGTLFSMIYGHWKNTIPKCDQYSRQVLQKLTEAVSVRSPQPRFIWAHLTIPHEPFCRNRMGKIQKDTAVGAMDSVFIKRKYIDYLSYGNSILISLIKKHPGLSDKIIVISGDHGPRFPYLTKKEYQKWPFAAIHFPTSYDTVGLQQLRYISQLPAFVLQYLDKGPGK